MDDLSPRLGNTPRISSRGIAILVLAGSLLTIAGWLFDVRSLTDWHHHGISMFFNSAVMAACAAVALLLRTFDHRRAILATRVLGSFVTAIAAVTFFQHLSGLDLGIDRLFITQPWGTRAATEPGRPGPPASISFTLLGIALVLSTGSRRKRSHVSLIGIVVAAIAMLSLIGYLFGADPLFAAARFTGIALQTAEMVFALAIGVLALVPECKPVRFLADPGAAGLLVRCTLPLVIGIPVLLGWLRIAGQASGFFDAEMGSAILVLSLILLLCAVLWFSASVVHTREMRLHSEIEERHQTEQSLAHRIHEQTVLFEFTNRLHRAESLSQVFDAGIDGICEALGSNRASILLFDDDSVMRFVASAGLSDTYKQAVEGHTPWKPADTDAKPFSVPDIEKADLQEDLKSVILAEGIRALAFIPLVGSGKLIGKFMVYHGSVHPFTTDELALALTIARQLVFGIESRRADERLRLAARKAEDASRAKDDFLAALSHELRTPLTPALMTVAALQDDPALPADVRQQLAMVARNIKLEGRLIDDLLDLTRINHGKLSIELVVADIHNILGHALETVRKEAQVKRLKIVQDLQAGEHFINADSVRLQQVFWNLLKNAVKFTPPGGSIRIESFKPSQGRVAIRIQDSGLGILPDAVPRIFRPFDQAGLEGRHEFGGLGLGLAISKAIVDAHHGAISVDSAGRGKGATFTVELDSTAAPESTPESTPVLRTSESSLRVLLVDDHEPTLSAMRRLLERDGHRVLGAGSVHEALSQAASFDCDIVISDLGLPDGTGFELMSEIRRLHGWPGIALSGYGMESDRKNSAEAGFTVHLIKPVEMADLRRAIELSLRKSSRPVPAPSAGS